MLNCKQAYSSTWAHGTKENSRKQAWVFFFPYCGVRCINKLLAVLLCDVYFSIFLAFIQINPSVYTWWCSSIRMLSEQYSTVGRDYANQTIPGRTQAAQTRSSHHKINHKLIFHDKVQRFKVFNKRVFSQKLLMELAWLASLNFDVNFGIDIPREVFKRQ